MKQKDGLCRSACADPIIRELVIDFLKATGKDFKTCARRGFYCKSRGEKSG